MVKNKDPTDDFVRWSGLNRLSIRSCSFSLLPEVPTHGAAGLLSRGFKSGMPCVLNFVFRDQPALALARSVWNGALRRRLEGQTLLVCGRRR